MTQPRDHTQGSDDLHDDAVQAVPEQSTRRTVRMQRVDPQQLAAEDTRRSEPPAAPRTTAPPPQRRASGAHASYDQITMLDAGGGVRRQHGSDPEFPGKAAYAVRVATLIGESLALGGFIALECRTAERSVFAYRDATGGVVAMTPRAGLDCSELRQQFWL